MTRLLISFPKSGRTWLRYALLHLGHGESIRFEHDGFEFNSAEHRPHDFNPGQRQYLFQPDTRIVYLERDPRDVMVSFYHQITGRFQDYHRYQGTISEFLRDDYFGARVLQGFRILWAGLSEQPGVLRVSYEECQRDLATVLAAILGHYGLPTDPAAIRRAVQEASFENMRRVEASGHFAEPWLRPRNRAPKVRRGQCGAYLSELGDEDIRYLNRVFGLDDTPAATGQRP